MVCLLYFRGKVRSCEYGVSPSSLYEEVRVVSVKSFTQLAVWLLRNPALYYPLDQEQLRPGTRANPVVEVRLWKTFVALFPDTLTAEPHPNLEDVVVVKLKVRCFFGYTVMASLILTHRLIGQFSFRADALSGYRLALLLEST